MQRREAAGRLGRVDVRVPNRSAKLAPRCGTTVKSARLERFVARAGAVQIVGQRDHPGLNVRGRYRVERAQQRGCGDVGGGSIADTGRKPGFRPPRHGALTTTSATTGITRSPARSQVPQ